MTPSQSPAVAATPSELDAHDEKTMREAFEKLGREMFAMTTTVHSPNIPFPEQCEMVPGLWMHCMQERDEARAALASRPGRAEPTELRAPSWPKEVLDFDQFLNEPPEYESQRTVREFRHQAYRKWEKVLAALYQGAKK